MKKVLLFSLVIWLAGLGGAKAQCREYIEAIAESELEPYVLDGNFESPILSEGESVEFYRTFMSGLNYKIDVCGMEMFFKEITISEVEKKDNGKRTVKNVLFKNFGKNTEKCAVQKLRQKHRGSDYHHLHRRIVAAQWSDLLRVYPRPYDGAAHQGEDSAL